MDGAVQDRAEEAMTGKKIGRDELRKEKTDGNETNGFFNKKLKNNRDVFSKTLQYLITYLEPRKKYLVFILLRNSINNSFFYKEQQYFSKQFTKKSGLDVT
jgi:hypothetical protein